jgi:hypothetical protein
MSRAMSTVHKDVLWHEVAFAPGKQLFSSLQGMQRRVPALTDMHKPVPVRVIAMLEPVVDEHVGRVVVKRFADEIAHGEGWELHRGVKTGIFVGIVERWNCVGVEIRQKVNVKSPALHVIH